MVADFSVSIINRSRDEMKRNQRKYSDNIISIAYVSVHLGTLVGQDQSIRSPDLKSLCTALLGIPPSLSYNMHQYNQSSELYVSKAPR